MTLQHILDYLKQYIDKKINTSSDAIKNVFDEYKVKDVADNIDAVSKTNDNIDDIKLVGSISDDIKSVSLIKDDIVRVSSDIDKATYIIDMEDEINNVYSIREPITTVSENINNVISVSEATDKFNDILEIKSDIINVSDVKNYIPTASLVGSNIDSVTTVSDNIVDVKNVNDNIHDVNTVAENIESVKITAQSIDNVNTYAKTYLGAKDTAPIVRNDGSPLQIGDFYYSIQEHKIKVYNGSEWAESLNDPNEIINDNVVSGTKTWSSEKISTFAGNMSLINTPSIITPTNGQADYLGAIQSSQFATSETFYGVHESTDWQLSKDVSFSVIEKESLKDATNLTSITFTELEPATTYYVRVRYNSDNHSSDWSDPISFTTPEDSIVTPSISCSTGDSLYPEFSLTEFETVGYTDEWASTDWQISTSVDFSTLVLNKNITDSLIYNTLTITEDILNVNSTYYVRARYNGSEGHSSDWSDIFTLNTGLYNIEISDIPDSQNEKTDINITVTHDNGRIFDNTFDIVVSVLNGTTDIAGNTITWHLPDVDSDTSSSISIHIEDNSGNTVTDTFTKNVLILNVPVIADGSISNADFSTNADTNDGFEY